MSIVWPNSTFANQGQGSMVDYVLSGAVEVRRGGRSVPLGGVKQRCVLAVLLANHGSVVSTDQLIQHVWEDDAPPKALASLRAYVSNLRRVLGDDDRDVADADPVRLETELWAWIEGPVVTGQPQLPIARLPRQSSTLPITGIDAIRLSGRCTTQGSHRGVRACCGSKCRRSAPGRG